MLIKPKQELGKIMCLLRFSKPDFEWNSFMNPPLIFVRSNYKLSLQLEIWERQGRVFLVGEIPSKFHKKRQERP
jgi:hypothetical protein